MGVISTSSFGFFTGGGGGGVTPLTELPIQNTLYVMKNGDDATGERNRLDKPFASISGASAVAQAGDCVYVYAGTYSEPVTWIKSDVYYWFEPNATLLESGSVSAIGDNNQAKNILIYGHGKFDGYRGIYTQNAGTTLHVECDSLDGQMDCLLNTGSVNWVVRARYATVAVQYGALLAGNTIYDIDIEEVDFDNTSLNAGGIILFNESGGGDVSRIKIGKYRSDGTGGIMGGVCMYNSPNATLIFECPDFKHTAGGNASISALFNFVGGGKMLVQNTNCETTNSNGIYFNNSIGGNRVFKMENSNLKANLVPLQVSCQSLSCSIQDSTLVKESGNDNPIVNLGRSGSYSGSTSLGNLQLQNVNLVNENDGVNSHGIYKEGTSELILDGYVGIYIENASAKSIFTASAQSINVQSMSVMVNKDVVGGGLLTNVVSGTNIVFDSNIKRLDENIY